MAAAAAGENGSCGTPRARSRLLSGGLHSLLLAAVALFFLNFNLAGTATPSKRFSQDLVYAWFGDESWLYPRASGPGPQGAPGAPKVVVALENEAGLAARGARWPAPVQFHVQFLSELEVLKPRALLLDFLLIDPAPREDVCALLALGVRLRGEHIPLYLAVTRPDDLAPMNAAGCTDTRGRALKVDDALIAVSVQRQADDSDFVSRRYPFEQRARNDAPTGSGLASAAVRMYCDTVASPDGCFARLTRNRPVNAGFELAWSPRGDAFNQRWVATSCIPETSPVNPGESQPGLASRSGRPAASWWCGRHRSAPPRTGPMSGPRTTCGARRLLPTSTRAPTIR